MPPAAGTHRSGPPRLDAGVSAVGIPDLCAHAVAKVKGGEISMSLTCEVLGRVPRQS